MQNTIKLSLFGNYEKFNTNNIDFYMKWITFFGKKGYKPATANELQLQANGQSKVLIMPVFLNNETGAIVEITSNRISFQKSDSNASCIETLNDAFVNEFSDLLAQFVTDAFVASHRLALNCEIFENDATSEMPVQSSYFDDIDKIEMSVRNVVRKEIEKEESNIILEKYVTTQGNFVKYFYEINSIMENQETRFSGSNIMKMYEAYIGIAMEIEKGMK